MNAKDFIARLFFATCLATTCQAGNANSYVAGSSPGTLINVDQETFGERPAINFLRPFLVRQAWFTSTVSPKQDRWTKRTKQLINADCDNEKIAILKSVEYFPNDQMGDSIDQEDHASNYEYVVPETTGYQMLRALCDF